ncbi:MAG: mycofactocin precursor MftA [Nocardioidaceae bacterium]
MPTPDPQPTQHTEHTQLTGHEEPPVTADDLLEEVSIDGMCGVY